MAEELFYVNGVDGTTGSYLVAPLHPEAISDRARAGTLDSTHLDELQWWHERATEAVFGPGEGLDPCDLAQVGWAVVFAQNTDPAVRAALRELLDHRRRQATAVHESQYREFWGDDGLRPGESKAQFLARHGAGPGPVDPARVPYYLLLVGDGREIPFSVQYQLDVQYAVGRLHFDTPEEYRSYAASVVASETCGVPRDPSVAFFAPQNRGDRATALSRSELVEPLAQRLAADRGDWKIRTAVAEDATKKCLVEMLGGAATPSVLFTAGHGLGWPSGHPAQAGSQGALVCQEWAGPDSRKAMSAEQYVGADDISDDATVQGLIAFHFACFGAGTPEFDDFAHRTGAATRGRLAAAPMISALPRRLLGHPRGGALAVAGHVDRAWSYSFTWPGAARQTEVYRSCLERLVRGHPIGSAFDYVNQRYAELSSDLSTALEEVKYGRRPDHTALATMWTANNDARGFVVLGDPAVRLPRAATPVAPEMTLTPVSVREPPLVQGPERPEAGRRLIAATERLAAVLEHAADGLAELEVVTSTSADLPAERYDEATARIRIVELLRTLSSVLGELIEALERT